jgi:hypothetical protein
MAKVYMTFMIEPEDKERMEEIAAEEQEPGEVINISKLYREAVRDLIAKRDKGK